MKKSDMYQALSVQLGRIEAKLDHVINKQNPTFSVGKCLFENMTPEERNKPLGLVCSCLKCSAYSLVQGSLTNPGMPQTWREGE